MLEVLSFEVLLGTVEAKPWSGITAFAIDPWRWRVLQMSTRNDKIKAVGGYQHRAVRQFGRSRIRALRWAILFARDTARFDEAATIIEGLPPYFLSKQLARFLRLYAYLLNWMYKKNIASRFDPEVIETFLSQTANSRRHLETTNQLSPEDLQRISVYQAPEGSKPAFKTRQNN